MNYIYISNSDRIYKKYFLTDSEIHLNSLATKTLKKSNSVFSIKIESNWAKERGAAKDGSGSYWDVWKAGSTVGYES